MGHELGCPVCQGQVHYKARAIQGYRQGSFFDVLECTNCKVSFVNPMEVDDRIYEAIYSNVASVPGYAGYFQLAQQVHKASDPLDHIAAADACYFGVTKHIRDSITSPATSQIIEIGCGQGYLTYALNKAGYRAIGIDISETGVQLAKQLFGDFYFCGQLADLVSASKERPALIVCTELIEHLADPFEFVRTALAQLEPGGQLLLTTPRKLEQEVSVWDTELPPVHLWWFTKQSLIEMSARLNTEIEFIDMSDFYHQHPGYRPGPLAEKALRPSFFDETYRLIAPIKHKGVFRQKLRTFEKRLKSLVYRVMNKDLHTDEDILSDANSISICAVLTKR
jgi:2-polyprenyl-3-methyl-5-hydroxy-6-metoxy-1,4-benzoquinol methylase